MAVSFRDSLSSVKNGLGRQEFLGYASHELRTPIAVTRTNSELLEKLIQKGKSPEKKQLEVVDRIKRAGFTMTGDGNLIMAHSTTRQRPASDNIHLGDMLQQINHDLTYLLNGKPVTVSLECDESQYQLPAGLTRIVLTNLIRNAYQHTGEWYCGYDPKGSSRYCCCNTDGSIEDNGGVLARLRVNRKATRTIWLAIPQSRTGWVVEKFRWTLRNALAWSF